MPGRRILLGVAFVCAGNLLLEVSLTRIFSAVMYYHFTFFAIALALLGIGASGVYVYVWSHKFTRATAEADLARNARRFALATTIALIYVLANPVVVSYEFGAAPTFSNQNVFQLVILCTFTALPFFWAGMVVTLAITHYRDHIDRVYFFDLIGAGAAALLVGLAIGFAGAPGLVIGVGVLACVASYLFESSRASKLSLGAMAALFVVALATPLFRPPSTKMVNASRVVFSGWNTFSHVTLEDVGNGHHDIRIDASARTMVTPRAAASSPVWRTDISALAYHVHPGGAGEVLIIGAGGGFDVAHALAANASHVTGVEINPLIAETIMQGPYKRLSDGLYDDPRVTIEVDEGRSFVRRSDTRYDVLQATLVDTWAATASGAFALTENALYTVEAFDDYYEHLTPGGVLTMTRWWSTASTPETMRLVILAAGALERRGVPPSETLQRILLAKKGNLATLIVKPAGFAGDDTARMTRLCADNGFEVVLAPGVAGDSTLARLVAAGAWSDQVAAYPQDITPPTDDRPFFFYFVKSGDLWRLAHLTGGKMANPALWLLSALALMLLALTVVFVFLPLVLRLRELRDAPGGLGRRVASLGYFAAIGFGFMVVEIALIQRLSLFLGHPSYALIVVLFAILVGTALGARLSKRLQPRAGRAVLAGGVVVAALAVIAAFTLAPVLRGLITMPLGGRVVVAGAIVFGFGVVMGVMLPLGVHLVSGLVGRADPALVSWAWGVNGGTSVIGTVGATVIAINYGFTPTFIVGAVLYVAAGVVGWRLGTSPVDREP